MIQIKNFRKVYNKEIIVEIRNYNFADGLHWIKGVNGSGKSTLLKCIAGLVPYEGEISIDKTSFTQKNIQKYCSLISLSHAEPVYPDFLSGSELINFYIESKNSNHKQSKGIIESLGVDKFCSKKIGTYSSGMIKKLSLALAFIGSSRIILLDEPFTTIDQKTNNVLFNIINQQLLLKKAILITSHHNTEGLSRLNPNCHEINNTQLKTV